MVPADSRWIPRVPRYSGYRYGPYPLRVRSCHALRPHFPEGSTRGHGPTARSYNPARAVTRTVWAPPRSLATTGGIIVIFFSCGYLDVSVPRVGLPLGGMAIAGRVAPFGYLRV